MLVNIGKQRFNVPAVHFTSDFHFNHDAIIRHCSRPFASLEEMDNKIIENINNIVDKDDLMFYLGDFCFQNRQREKLSLEETAEKYRSLIKCKNIFFVWGNHDKKLRNSNRFNKLWLGTYDILPIEVDGNKIILCHYPMKEWEKSQHKSWHLYGHAHGDCPEDKSLSFDVGVDPNGFKPVSYSEVYDRMSGK